MIQLQELIKPTWSSEKFLQDAWSNLNDADRLLIKQRLDDMFYNELPFQLEHSKIQYIHLFAFLTRLETFGLQGMIKTFNHLNDPTLRTKLHQQILDEIFHAIVFAKITYQLSAPYALPPAENNGMEKFMSLIVNEPDFKIALVMINLVAEGLIEEIFLAIKQHKIAPHIFEVIIEDESRHLDEFDLYVHIGLPSKKNLSKKLAIFEEELIKMVFSQEKFVLTLVNLLGVNGIESLIHNIDKKHNLMLKKIDFSPSENWKFFMSSIHDLVHNVFYNQHDDSVVEQTITHKIFTSMWDDPSQPIETSSFSLNITPLGFFEKKFKSETSTCLVLQAISKVCSENPQLRNYICNRKVYESKHNYVGLAVLLPGCDGQLGMIQFKNCHEMNISDLSHYIQNDLQMMVYCYNKVKELQIEHPYLCDIVKKRLCSINDDPYRSPHFARPTISLSNIGPFGYELATSPLFPNETMKFTLTKIDRKQIWNKITNQFEVQDLLPVQGSVDHRVMDGNIPLPYMLQKGFDQMFEAMINSLQKPHVLLPVCNLDVLIKWSEELLINDLEFGFMTLFSASQVWDHQYMQEVITINKVSDKNHILCSSEI